MNTIARKISIRQSLLRQLVIVVLLLGTTIFGVFFLGSRRAVQRLSAVVIERTLGQAEAQLEGFFQPISAGLDITRERAESNVFEGSDPEVLNPHFLPLLRRHPQISSLIVADERGREYLALRLGETWANRETRRDEWGSRSRWREWSDDPLVPAFEEWRDLDYDPRTRPWFKGALEARGGPTPPVHWTAPYEFFTTKEPGITASITFDREDGTTGVIGFDVLLRELSNFMTELEVSENGMAFMLTEDREFIAVPRMRDWATEEAQLAAILKHPEDLGVAVVTDAQRAIAAKGLEWTGPVRFRSEGQVWWGDVAPFELGGGRTLRVAVLLPEADLLGSLIWIRWAIIGLTLLILGVAVARAIVVARRFSQPIEALVHESDRISRLKLEDARVVETPIAEMRRLADAHDRMRVSLRSLLRLEKDLQVARQIQQNTFPDALPDLPGFEIGAYGEPADETGGDTYDVVGFARRGDEIELEGPAPDHAVMMLGDATGHGVGPALCATQLRAMLRMAIRLGSNLADVAYHMNEQLYADLPSNRFITTWLGILDAKARTVTTFSAGQGPILFYEASANAWSVIPTDAPPLGIMPELEVEVPAPTTMRAGDLLAVISDGVFEAPDPNAKLFGTQRVQDLLYAYRDRHPDEILTELRAVVDTYTEGAPPGDDCTAILLKCTG